MRKDEEFTKYWEAFLAKGCLLYQLSDEELNQLLSLHSAKFFPQVGNEMRLHLFINEKNSRSADKVARTGAILTGVAVVLGFIQIIVALN